MSQAPGKTEGRTGLSRSGLTYDSHVFFEGAVRNARKALGGLGHIAGSGHRRSAIRVGIVDDHPVFRLGLKRALERESDIDITWEMGSAANLDALMRKTPVDVILMDIYMAGKDGVTATREVTEKWPEVKIAAISASLDTRVAPASKRAGADIFLSKTLPVAEMVSSIRNLAASNPNESRVVKAPRRPQSGKQRVGGLSPRQRQVLQYMRLGSTNREIAGRMDISIGTVNKHVQAVLTALKVRNRTQAVAAAREDIRD